MSRVGQNPCQRTIMRGESRLRSARPAAHLATTWIGIAKPRRAKYSPHLQARLATCLRVAPMALAIGYLFLLQRLLEHLRYRADGAIRTPPD